MEILTSPDTYRAEPERAWMRLKTRVRKPKELAVLIEVAAWREREAQTRDVPRSRVLKDDAIGDIAVQAPTTAGAARPACARCRRASSARTGAKAFSTAVQARSRARSRRTCRALERPKPVPNGTATVELLKVLLRMTSENHGVAAKVIATVDDLERIAGDDEADVAGAQGLAARTVRRAGARRSSTASWRCRSSAVAWS